MARRKLETAEERTVSMFQEPGQQASAAPLGALSPEDRAKDISKTQDDAIARAREKLDQKLTSKDLEEAQKYAQDERAAIQAEDPIAGMEASRARMNERMKEVDAAAKGALGAGFFGNTPAPAPAPAPAQGTRIVGDTYAPTEDEGDEVHCTKGEEMYGKPGQFSTYRVGPFSGSTKVRPGETRAQARRRLMDELHAFADEEREKAKQAFLSHYPKAFG